MLDSWLPFLIYGLFALAIPASMVVLSFVFATRPSRRTRARAIPFESGVSTGPPPQQRFTVSFYLTAMLFIVFDIEIVFLYPLAVVLERARLVRRSSSSSSSSRSSRSPTSTSGGRGRSSGGRRSKRLARLRASSRSACSGATKGPGVFEQELGVDARGAG